MSVVAIIGAQSSNLIAMFIVSHSFADRIAIVNGAETAMDRYADWLLVSQIGEILPALVNG